MLILLIISIILVLVDQSIKVIVINTLSITEVVDLGIIKLEYMQNKSILFGKDINTFLIVIWIVLASLFVYWFLTKFATNVKNKYNYIPFILVISGIIANLIDRMTKGFVITYIRIPMLLKDISFNFANACLIVGLILTEVFYLLKINDMAIKKMDLSKIEKRNEKK